MLTNLNWLSPGQAYPPASEADRLNQYHTNEQLFLCVLPDSWREDFQNLAQARRIRDEQVDLFLCYHQALSAKMADLVCGSGPVMESETAADTMARLLEQKEIGVCLSLRSVFGCLPVRKCRVQTDGRDHYPDSTQILVSHS